MRQKLTVVTLGAVDWQKSVDFYEKGLGWKRSSASQGDLALFSLGSFALAIYPKKALAEDACVPDAPSGGFSGVTLALNAKSEAEVDEIFREAANAGAQIVKPPQKVFWGGYSGYFKDSEGRLFEVAYNPYWKLSDDGGLELP